MKRVLLCCTVSVATFGQTTSPIPSIMSAPAQVPADKVVARVDGRDVTAAEVQAALANMPQEFGNLYKQNPVLALQQMFMMRYLASEAEQKKLAEESPLKEQLEAARANMMAAAMLAWEQNHFSPAPEAIDEYYKNNQARFQQAKIKAVSISFSASNSTAATFEERARAQLEKQLGRAQRTEEEARARAAEALAKLKSGADFAQIVNEYSDDAPSKANGGEFGAVRSDGPQPDDYKKAIFALKPGELSAPLRLPNAIVVARLEGMEARPKNEVTVAIIQQLRQDHFNQWIGEISKRFQPSIQAPEFFSNGQPAMPPTPGLPPR